MYECDIYCYLIRPLKGLSFNVFDIVFFCSRDYESLKKEDVFQNNHLVRSLLPIHYIVPRVFQMYSKNAVNHIKVKDSVLAGPTPGLHYKDCSETLTRLTGINVKWFLIGDGSGGKKPISKINI